jgi:hypothetical protein
MASVAHAQPQGSQYGVLMDAVIIIAASHRHKREMAEHRVANPQ